MQNELTKLKIMKFGIIVFPGSNCDRDVATVTEGIFRQPTRYVWHQETDLADLDVIVVPGGFSYGDYLRCGAIARFSPAMKTVREEAEKGKLVLGIWQGIYLWEHRQSRHQRQVVVHITGV